MIIELRSLVEPAYVYTHNKKVYVNHLNKDYVATDFLQNFPLSTFTLKEFHKAETELQKFRMDGEKIAMDKLSVDKYITTKGEVLLMPEFSVYYDIYNTLKRKGFKQFPNEYLRDTFIKDVTHKFFNLVAEEMYRVLAYLNKPAHNALFEARVKRQENLDLPYEEKEFWEMVCLMYIKYRSDSDYLGKTFVLSDILSVTFTSSYDYKVTDLKEESSGTYGKHQFNLMVKQMIKIIVNRDYAIKRVNSNIKHFVIEKFT